MRQSGEVNAMAEKKPTYKEIMAERDAYKHELDVMKQDRVNRQAKNSVFLNLFMRKEYQFQLYKELFRRTPRLRKMIWNW